MPKLFTKLLLSFLLSIFVFSTFASLIIKPIQAQTNVWYDQSFPQWHAKVFNDNSDEIFGERYTRAQVQWIIYSLFSFFIDGVNPDAGRIITCLSTRIPADCAELIKVTAESLTTVDINSTQNSQTLVEAIFQERPISMVTYIKDSFRNLNIISEANAQTGFGFTALNPILELWKASRNVTYVLFIVILIAMSFMIMFRVKLSPQTVITVQSALPKVAFSLILITFSYAIAGLLIDLMYVFIGLIGLVLSSSGIYTSGKTPVDFFNLMTQGPELGPVHLGIFGFITKYWIGSVIFMAMIVFTADSWFVKVGALFGVILMLLVVFILLWNWIRIIWMLFKATAMVLLQTIFAPFQILLGTIVPNLGFNSWLRDYIANLAVFPITGLLFVLSSLFLTMAIKTSANSIWDITTLLGMMPFGNDIINVGSSAITGGSHWPPLIVANDSATTAALVLFGVSFVIITIIPKTVQLIQAIIKGGQFNYGSAIGESTGVLTAIPTSIWGGVKGAGQKASGEAILGRGQEIGDDITNAAREFWRRGRTRPGSGSAGGGGTRPPTRA